MSNIIQSLHSASSLAGRVIARAKQDGELVSSKAAGKADSKTALGSVTLTEQIKAAGCTSEEKRALDIVRVGSQLESLTGYKFAGLIPRSEIEAASTARINAEAELATARDLIESLQSELAKARESAASPAPKKKAVAA